MSRRFQSCFLSLIYFCGVMVGAAQADTPNYISFFTAGNGAYQAYLDQNNRTTDTSGSTMVNAKVDTFSDAFRGWIKRYFPGGENAAYAIQSYGLNCSARTVASHTVTYYDANGMPLASHDYGGAVTTPITGSMEFYMMQKICGG
jgi:hypothetical protein